MKELSLTVEEIRQMRIDFDEECKRHPPEECWERFYAQGREFLREMELYRQGLL